MVQGRAELLTGAIGAVADFDAVAVAVLGGDGAVVPAGGATGKRIGRGGNALGAAGKGGPDPGGRIIGNATLRELAEGGGGRRNGVPDAAGSGVGTGGSWFARAPDATAGAALGIGAAERDRVALGVPLGTRGSEIALGSTCSRAATAVGTTGGDAGANSSEGVGAFDLQAEAAHITAPMAASAGNRGHLRAPTRRLRPDLSAYTVLEYTPSVLRSFQKRSHSGFAGMKPQSIG